MNSMPGSISESRFNMWRAVVAMIHADEVVKPHEINFVLQSTRDLPFTNEQRGILSADIHTRSDIHEFFGKITNPKDKLDFFHLARAAAWADGDFDEREERLIARLAGLPLQEKDKELLRRSVEDFEDTFVHETQKTDDQTLMTVIRTLIRRAA